MSEGGSSYRPMKYPYTYTAKFVQFPFKYYVKHSWLFKYWLIGAVVAAPLFYKIQKMSYAPANVEKWKKLDQELFKAPSHPH